MALSLGWLRTRVVWLFVIPFFLLARPTVPLLLAGLAVALVGAAIRAWAAGAIHKNRRLTVSGPYAYTRNPLYLGSALIGLGVVVASGRLVLLLAFLLFFGFVYRKTIRREERKLGGLFGDAFREYTACVPPFFPHLTPYRSGEASPGFSLQQYLRNREYQAALGIAAGFAALAIKMVWM